MPRNCSPAHQVAEGDGLGTGGGAPGGGVFHEDEPALELVRANRLAKRIGPVDFPAPARVGIVTVVPDEVDCLLVPASGNPDVGKRNAECLQEDPQDNYGIDDPQDVEHPPAVSAPLQAGPVRFLRVEVDQDLGTDRVAFHGFLRLRSGSGVPSCADLHGIPLVAAPPREIPVDDLGVVIIAVLVRLPHQLRLDNLSQGRGPPLALPYQPALAPIEADEV